MGVKTALAGITLTAADLAAAPDDMKGNLQIAQLKCAELTALLTRIQTVMSTLASPADSANATTIGTQITALS